MNAKALRAYPRGMLDAHSYERRSGHPIATLEALIEMAYPTPSQYDSAESFARYHHDDIEQLSDEALDRERVRARFAWAFSADPSPWLIERIAQLEGAARARQKAR